MLGIEPELLRLQPGVLPMSYTHHKIFTVEKIPHFSLSWLPNELLLLVLELLSELPPLLLLAGQQVLQHPLVGLSQLGHDTVQVPFWSSC